jgi:hypothetical protein
MHRTVELTRRRYGAHPAHLVAVLVGFVVAALALHVLLGERRRDVGGWLVGSAVAHDALLVPAYIGLDALLVALWRRRPGRVPWLNHVRMPAAFSGLLLVIWSPEILRKAQSFQHQTGRSTDPYLAHWLFVTAVLFGGSALLYLARVAKMRR